MTPTKRNAPKSRKKVSQTNQTDDQLKRSRTCKNVHLSFNRWSTRGKRLVDELFRKIGDRACFDKQYFCLTLVECSKFVLKVQGMVLLSEPYNNFKSFSFIAFFLVRNCLRLDAYPTDTRKPNVTV